MATRSIAKPPINRATTSQSLLIKIDAEECKRSLKTFAQRCWHIIEPTQFVDGMPIEAMIVHLEAITKGEITRLLINIPPRHTKSTLVSVIWPVWVWLQQPSERFLCASYSLDLSSRDNLRKRRIIEDPWFQERFGTIFQLTADQNAKRYFENDQHGYQMSISVGGGTTGQGGSYLCLDDAHNASEAYSEIDRNNAVIWFREVWTNRLNNQAKDKMVVVGQRIHDEDVCGYIVKERPDWTHLNLPAYYESANKCVTKFWSDPRTQENQVLWPERFTDHALQGLRRDLGSTGFAAQYQQRPVPAGGGQFKKQWFRYYEKPSLEHFKLMTPEGPKQVLRSDCQTIITVDLAISLKQSADFTVFAVWSVTKEKEVLLIDLVRDHLSNPDQQKGLNVLYQKYRPKFIHIENVAYQLALIQQLLKEGIPVKEFKPTKDKVARASTASVFYEAGRIYHPRTATFLSEFEDELLVFPMGKHDDQVDAVSMICDSLSELQWDADDHIAMMKRRVELARQRGMQIVKKPESIQDYINHEIQTTHQIKDVREVVARFGVK